MFTGVFQPSCLLSCNEILSKGIHRVEIILIILINYPNYILIVLSFGSSVLIMIFSHVLDYFIYFQALIDYSTVLLSSKDLDMKVTSSSRREGREE